jgi:hypothetical protein
MRFVLCSMRLACTHAARVCLFRCAFFSKRVSKCSEAQLRGGVRAACGHACRVPFVSHIQCSQAQAGLQQHHSMYMYVHTHTHTYTHTHTHTLTHTHTHTHTHTLTHTHTHTHTHLFLSRCTYIYINSFSLSLSLTHTQFLVASAVFELGLRQYLQVA